MLKDNPLPSTPKRSDSGLYTVLCINTKRQYIGHSNDVQQRLTIHKYQLKHNKHFCFDLQEDFNRYGESSFVFERIALGESYPKQERQNLEKCLIKLIPKEFLYNKFASPNDRRGKLGANFGNRHTLETKEKIRASKSLNNSNKFAPSLSLCYSPGGQRSCQRGLCPRPLTPTNPGALRLPFGNADVKPPRGAQLLAKLPSCPGGWVFLRNTIKSSDKRLKPVSIDGIAYNSVAQAHRETGIARRLIRQRCWSVDHPSYTWSRPNYIIINNPDPE